MKAEEIERVLDVAAQMKRIVLSGNKKKDYLKGTKRAAPSDELRIITASVPIAETVSNVSRRLSPFT